MYFENTGNIDLTKDADDSTLYKYSSKIEHVLTNLQVASENLFRSFFASH